MQTWKGTTFDYGQNTDHISLHFRWFWYLYHYRFSNKPQLINKTALYLSSSSQTNAGALWFMCCIRLLYVTDAFWLFIERAIVWVLSSPSVFRHFGSVRKKIPKVKLAIVKSPCGRLVQDFISARCNSHCWYNSVYSVKTQLRRQDLGSVYCF